MAASFRPRLAGCIANGCACGLWCLFRLARRGFVLAGADGLLAKHADPGVEGQRPNLRSHAYQSIPNRADCALGGYRRPVDGSRAVTIVLRPGPEAALFAAMVAWSAAHVAATVLACCQLHS